LVTQLAEVYGTPMFVYDRAVLDLMYDGCVSPFAFSLEYAIRGSGPKHFQPRKNFGNPLLSEKHQDACSRKHLRSHLSR
jgi:hypothetical protein